MDKSVEIRRQEIISLLAEKGRIEVAELSRSFGVSAVVIRKDLQELENQGLLSRIHGGAISSYKTYYNMNFRQRVHANEKEKHLIAEKVADIVKDNDTLFINAGTTTLFCFRALQKHKNLNIVTNSVAIALEAAETRDMNVVLLGGDVNGKYQFTYGMEALKLLERYHADKFILSVDGVCPEGGLTTYYQQEADICLKMIERAGETIVVADHTKLFRTAFTKIAPLTKADILITENTLTPSSAKKLEKSRVKIIKV